MKRRTHFYWLFVMGCLINLLQLLLASNVNAQVVNMESRRRQTDSILIVGDINVAFLYNSTNGKSIATFRGSAGYQQKSKNLKHLFLFVSNYDLAKAEGDEYVNAFFAHLRYNYKIKEWLRWELFTQFQKNPPLGIRLRQLTGTGPRFKIKTDDYGLLYLGTAYMYEYENATAAISVEQHNHRFSSYASYSLGIPAINADLVTTCYYQPLFTDIADFRLTNETRLDFRITKSLRIYTRFNYMFDSNPPAGIRKEVLGLEQGFGFSF